MVAVRGDLYVVEPNHGEVIRVSPDTGAIVRVVDVSATQGHIVRSAHLEYNPLPQYNEEQRASQES
jgi:hypothetical protein